MDNFNSTDLLRRVRQREHNMDVFFLVTNAIIIYLMQCGFGFLEAGSIRSKNVTNILIKNVMASFFAAVAYWICGYAFAYGPSSNAFIGYSGFASVGLDAGIFHFWFFHFVFAANCASIVSGAVAERCCFLAYLVHCCVTTGFIYPVISHWAWAKTGWLKHLGFVDFAGSGVVHLTGGTCALLAAAIIGPRIGVFVKRDGHKRLREISGHSVPFAALGGFILFFGFFSFNASSQGHISKPGDGVAVAKALKSTILSASFGALIVMLMARLQQQRWSLTITINGGLTGMVAICAGCHTVAPWAAAVIGAVAGLTYMIWAAVIDKLRIDDPLNAAAVHAGGGSWGLLAVALFHQERGIFSNLNSGEINDALEFLGFNVVGMLVILAWAGFWSGSMYLVLKLMGILRVPNEAEVKGLDIYYHQEPAYPSSAYGHGWGGSWKNTARFDNLDSHNDSTTGRTNPSSNEELRERRPWQQNGSSESSWNVPENVYSVPVPVVFHSAPYYGY